MLNKIISDEYLILIIVSVILGTLARVFTLIVDYRQYPTYPNGYLTNLVTGFIAAALGAMAIPAVIAKDYEAFTFLALAIEQFRDIRRIENESLQVLDDVDYIYRGNAYIDGIAKTFEARNYFSLIVAFTCSLTMQLVPRKMLWLNILSGIAAGSIVFIILKQFSKGKTVGDIADVKLGKIEVKNSELYVDGIFITNHLGTDAARSLVQKEGVAAVVYPKKNHYRIALDNAGQRQAMLFEAYRSLGLKRYHFTRKDYESGRIVIMLVPIIDDKGALIESVRKTPLLESVRKSHEVMKTNFINKKQP